MGIRRSQLVVVMRLVQALPMHDKAVLKIRLASHLAHDSPIPFTRGGH